MCSTLGCVRDIYIVGMCGCVHMYVRTYIRVWAHVLHVWVYASHVRTFDFCTGFLATRSFRPSNKDFNCLMPCNVVNFSILSSRDSCNEADSGVPHSIYSSCNGIESNNFRCCIYVFSLSCIQHLLCTSYHMAMRALANLSHEGDKLAKLFLQFLCNGIK